MGLLQLARVGLLVAFAEAQALFPCSGTSVLTVATSEDAATLASSLRCLYGDFAVQWIGEVVVAETIRVANRTSLNITGDGKGATVDGGSRTQLFVVEGGSWVHFTDMSFANGNASSGGAIFADDRSGVSFRGATAFTGNVARGGGGAGGDGDGGAIFAKYSTLLWDGGGDATLAMNSASRDGGAIYALWSDVSWKGGGNTIFADNSADGYGGAIHAHGTTASWDQDGAQFRNNHADNGGAISAYDSTVSWNGDDTYYANNNASTVGGAIYAASSAASWDGDGAYFEFNTAGEQGGAIYADTSTVHWNGDRFQFRNNEAENGGAISALDTSNVSWSGDGTAFIFNSGSAIAMWRANLSWSGDGTVFSKNSGFFGGAIAAGDSSLSWNGEGAHFDHNSAAEQGGAIFADGDSMLSWDVNTTFSNNEAGTDGGALALSYMGDDTTILSIYGGAFIGNSAARGRGGATYMEQSGFNFENVTFQSNSASVGGAVANSGVGFLSPARFSRCSFVGNTAVKTGGAIETLFGAGEFRYSSFEGNSAGVGGAMRLGGGSTMIGWCSFRSNSASIRGPAITVMDYYYNVLLEGLWFEDNGLYCPAGFFLEDVQQEDTSTWRYEAVCLDCPDWEECGNCTIETANMLPTCSTPLDHTTADKPGVDLETLSIMPGYWRATNQSYNILACFNTDACIGGRTGADRYCDHGYTGPYCAVCKEGYSASLAHTCMRCSTSRRQGFMAASVVAAFLAVYATSTIFRYLLSLEFEETNIGSFHRKVHQAFPLQALKTVIVVWQILTQFAEVANITYPGVYDYFLRAIAVVNFDLGSILSAGCLWSDIDFHDRLLVSTIVPLVVIGILALTYVAALRKNAKGGRAIVEKIRHKHLTVLLFVTFLVYSSVSSTVFQTFACESLDDGNEYLRADYQLLCSSAKHRLFQVYAVVMVIVYPVGTPVLYSVLLFQHRGVLADASADKTAAEPISSLWQAYRPECFFYEVIECGRRIMLTGVIVFIYPNDAAQIAINILIAVFFFAVFDVLSPYVSETDMWLSRGGHGIVFLSMFDLLLLKVDVSRERSQSQEVFAGVLVACHVLMLLTIVAQVVGICYASRRNRAVDEANSVRAFSELPVVTYAGSEETPLF